ncbi:hypothetical protein [Sphingobacterium siyangense]|uniref:Lipoprotein n=1 Tax=Sphingobacterium siyangense TaxID=459529 RepID=A0A562MKG9_9SPHI|nr:hypothetical protein [Sphingobacterium siyangense]TWI20366.1 hypothetical protein IQ31_02321 [Sphingobacterium siyangense]
MKKIKYFLLFALVSFMVSSCSSQTQIVRGVAVVQPVARRSAAVVRTNDPAPVIVQSRVIVTPVPPPLVVVKRESKTVVRTIPVVTVKKSSNAVAIVPVSSSGVNAKVNSVYLR